MWEDEANKYGGRFTLRLNKGFSNKVWEDLVLGMIGEQFDAENEIHGVIVSVRHNLDTISVWIKNGRDQSNVQKIKQDIMRICSLSDEIKVDFESFFKDPAEQQ